MIRRKVRERILMRFTPFAAVFLNMFNLLASPAWAQSTSTPAEASNSAALGFVGDAHGWIHFTKFRADVLDLAHRHTSSLAGRRAGGTCLFEGTGAIVPTGAAVVYEETTAINLSSCQQQILVGIPSAAAVRAESSAHGLMTHTTGSSTSAKAMRTPKVARAPLAATSSFSTEAYEKTGWIDPLQIIITSYAIDLTWQNNGITVPSAGVEESKYTFSWDNWYGGTLPFISMKFANQQVATNEQIVYYNNDFAAFIRATLGLSGFVACSATSATATFLHHLYLTGRDNGTAVGNYSDSVSARAAIWFIIRPGTAMVMPTQCARLLDRIIRHVRHGHRGYGANRHPYDTRVWTSTHTTPPSCRDSGVDADGISRVRKTSAR